MACCACSASYEPHSPETCHVPKAMRETCRPLRPSVVYSMSGGYPMCRRRNAGGAGRSVVRDGLSVEVAATEDRKSTRLNSSHANISYAVFCLKKKKIIHYNTYQRHSS